MELIDKIQRQLDDNHYIEAEDIQKLIDGYRNLEIVINERYEDIHMRRKLAEDKPDGSNGGGESFWDGREREIYQVRNIIKKTMLFDDEN